MHALTLPVARGGEAIVAVQAEYQAKYMHAGRYVPTASLPDANAQFRGLSEAEKAQQLIAWFDQAVANKLKSLAWRLLMYKVAVLLFAVPIFLLIFGTAYISIAKTLYSLLLALRQKKDQNSDRVMESLTALSNVLAQFSLLSLFSSQASQLPIQQAESGSHTGQHNNVGFLFILVTLYYAGQYAGMPFVWLWRYVSDIWQLYQFIRYPYLVSPAKGIDHLYVSTRPLLSETVRKRVEKRLIAAHQGAFKPIPELYAYIVALRALPRGVRALHPYDEQAIKNAFGEYDPNTIALAEELIALLYLYTELVAQGNPDPLQGLPLKPILLVGPTGVGKSNFAKKIDEVTGCGLVYMDPSSRRRAVLHGQSSETKRLGSLGIYVETLVAHADLQGRNHLNNIMVLDELTNSWNDTATVAFLKNFLDSQETHNIQDACLGMPVPKLPFIIAMSNTLPKDKRLCDRFMIIRLDHITKPNQKHIIQRLINEWVTFTTESGMQEALQLNKEAFSEHLTKDAHAFIDKQKGNTSMRPVEEHTVRKVLSLIRAHMKSRQDNRRDSTKHV